MPAPAVIPAPVAYTNVVAVKKLVVGFGAVDCRFGCTRISARSSVVQPPALDPGSTHTGPVAPSAARPSGLQ